MTPTVFAMLTQAGCAARRFATAAADKIGVPFTPILASERCV
jgi:hypothetical protein